MNEGIGKSLAWVLLAGFGLYAALKYYQFSVKVQKRTQNAVVAPAGVNYYCNQPVTQRFAQTQAYQSYNCDAVTVPGFAAAFGPNENQPGNVASLCI